MTRKNRQLSSFNKRFIYLIALILTMLLGLSSRIYSQNLPSFIVEHAGDFLWAMMVYFGFRFIITHQKLYLAFLLSLLFSLGIEFSQLYQAEWINRIRASLLGGLVLGKGYLSIDLLRYTVGICSAIQLDKWWQSKFTRKRTLSK